MATYVEIDGHPTWVADRGGSGESLLLLHGGLSNSDQLLDNIGPGLAAAYIERSPDGAEHLEVALGSLVVDFLAAAEPHSHTFSRTPSGACERLASIPSITRRGRRSLGDQNARPGRRDLAQHAERRAASLSGFRACSGSLGSRGRAA